jgi:molybdopterin converting factor small subunit
MLTVKLFAKARDLVGSPSVQIPWSADQSVADLKQRLGELHPSLAPLLPRLLVAVNNDYASEAKVICATDEVACFPPVSGG